MMSYWMNVLEVYKFATCGKRCGFQNILPKRDFIILLLIEVSGHGVGFALVLANYCFMAPTGQPRLSKKSLRF
jgi:hypothetical protein